MNLVVDKEGEARRAEFTLWYVSTPSRWLMMYKMIQQILRPERIDLRNTTPIIHFEPDNLAVISDESETILSSGLRAGISHAHACGGNARCSTCRILIEQGLDRCVPRSEPERALSERLHFSSEVRLACQTSVRGDISVRRMVLDEEDAVLTKRILENPGVTSIGEEKNLAILFADIRGFTPLSERLLPYDVIYILNLYFDHMGKVISAHGGHIDNYMGDGLERFAFSGRQGSRGETRGAYALVREHGESKADAVYD